jgi:DNA-binding transcriptional LysR family regulator
VALRLDYVAGVSPAKWLRVWGDRRPDLPLEARRVPQSEQLTALLAGDADVAFVRLPVDDDGLHTIPLWEERAVAVLPKEHPLAAAESLVLADLDGEPRAPEQADAAMTVELVAAGTGLALMPHGVARLHHRRDVVAIPVTDAATTRVALVWRVERDDADIQEFVGVVRGRTARSSRGDDAEADATAAAAAAAAAKRAPAKRSDPKRSDAKRGTARRVHHPRRGGGSRGRGGRGR